MKILIVEDNPSDVVLMREMLKSQDIDFELFSASTLSQALALVVQHKPSIILLDLTLPDSSGLKTFTQMNTIASPIPIILLTGNADHAIALSAVKQGAQDYLVKGKFNDELLVRAIAYAIERQQVREWVCQYQEDMARIERINSMGEISLTIAHELNQPLTAIVAYAQGCVRALQTGKFPISEITEHLQKVVLQAEHAGKIIHRLKRFVYKGELALETIQINELINETISLLPFSTKKIPVVINLKFEENIPLIKVDATQIQQVIINLLRNGMEAFANSRIVDPNLTLYTCFNDGYVQVKVIDNGSGLAKLPIAQLFEPKFTTKPKGMGMGLAICRTIIEAHGGWLEAKEQSPQGACFQFFLPITKL